MLRVGAEVHGFQELLIGQKGDILAGPSYFDSKQTHNNVIFSAN